jgi:hypothetical protein
MWCAGSRLTDIHWLTVMFQRSLPDTLGVASRHAVSACSMDGHCSVPINSGRLPREPQFTMIPNSPPTVVLCPRCFCPMDIRHVYPFGPPTILQPPPPLPLGLPGQHSTNSSNAAAHLSSPPPPVYQQNNTPAIQSPELSSNSRPPQHNNRGESQRPSTARQQNDIPTLSPEPSSSRRHPGHENRGKNRRSSVSSVSSADSNVSDFWVSADFFAELQAVEDRILSQERPRGSVPPPSTSSTSTGSSSAQHAISTHLPSSESSLIPSTPDEAPSTMRRWVVFRGRAPGIYASSYVLQWPH